MRIEEIKLKNIGPFEEETIQFQPIPNGEDKAEIHIFTGPNGSGKSTILHALASAFIYKDTGGWKGNQIEKRLHKNKKESFVSTRNIDEQVFSLKYDKYKTFISETTKGQKDKIDLIIYRSSQTAREVTVPLNYACFAYSGYRDMSYEKIEAIKEVGGNPLKDALIFNKKTKNNVNQWLANMIAKKAIAKDNKQLKEAENYRQNIQSLENILQKLLNQNIQFELETNPTNIVLRKNGMALDFDVIPDGLKSIISWLGDLLMRLDNLPWENNTPILKRNILLFLDEIEVHLHPKWQMKILPIVQELFPNAQIFISTHSPFVVNSVDDAWVYKLTLDDKGVATCQPPILSETGRSYSYVLDEIFEVEETFGLETEQMLDDFYKERDKVLKGEPIDEEQFKKMIAELMRDGIEVQQIIGHELRQIKRITKKDYTL